MWVLRTKPLSFGKAASVLYCSSPHLPNAAFLKGGWGGEGRGCRGCSSVGRVYLECTKARVQSPVSLKTRYTGTHLEDSKQKEYQKLQVILMFQASLGYMRLS